MASLGNSKISVTVAVAVAAMPAVQGSSQSLAVYGEYVLQSQGFKSYDDMRQRRLGERIHRAWARLEEETRLQEERRLAKEKRLAEEERLAEAAAEAARMAEEEEDKSIWQVLWSGFWCRCGCRGDDELKLSNME
jgi:hypothetical protein